MREFEHPNKYHGFECPICRSSKDHPVVLVGIPGTERGGIMEAKQVHSECYKLFAKMHGVEIEIESWEDANKRHEKEREE